MRFVRVRPLGEKPTGPMAPTVCNPVDDLADGLGIGIGGTEVPAASCTMPFRPGMLGKREVAFDRFEDELPGTDCVRTTNENRLTS